MRGSLSIVAFAASAVAQQRYTWGSVVYNRAGESGPDLLGVGALTSIGAQQSYQAGQFFRERYLTSSTTNISGLNQNLINLSNTYVLALDTPGAVGSAQAFMQGLYPPYSLSNNASSAANYDPTSVTSTGNYVEAPLNGYQYPQIHVSGALDPDYIFIGGNNLCPSLQAASSLVSDDADYQTIKSSSTNVYAKFGTLLSGVIQQGAWNFDYAYSIYNYISYLAEHNATVANLLQSPSYMDPTTQQSYLYTLKRLADQQQQFLLTNQSAVNVETGLTTLPYTGGSISTVAGNMLAGKILTQLIYNNITLGNDYKLSVMFGSFEPLMSLFSLMPIETNAGANATGIPETASSAVFELYSLETSKTPSYPSQDNMYVSFNFRNGSGSGIGFSTAMSINMKWLDFVHIFTWYDLGDVGDWCTQCGATNLFCAAWNSTLSYVPLTASSASSSSSSHQVSPVVAGVIGAIVSLAVAGLIFALIMFFGRVRLHRQPRNKNADLGGFKGSAKLASDQDLTLPKNGVTIGTDEVAPVAGHERIGSWEMKNGAADNKAALPRYSLDEDHVEHASPVVASERV